MTIDNKNVILLNDDDRKKLVGVIQMFSEAMVKREKEKVERFFIDNKDSALIAKVSLYSTIVYNDIW